MATTDTGVYPPLYLRTWRLRVLTPDNGNGQQTLIDISSQQDATTNMKITFDVDTHVFRAYWQAEIVIFNPSLQLTQMIVQGSEVSLAVGYRADGEPTEIFRGVVYQPLWEKRDATDVMLTLLCMVGLDKLTKNIIHVVTGKFAQQRDIVLAMAQGASSPITMGYLAPQSDFRVQALPRSATIFGTPSTLFADVAKANDMVCFHDQNGLNLGKLARSDSSVDITYAPPLQPGDPPDTAATTHSLLGVPQQTELGVAYRTLIDPKHRVKLPPMQVQLRNSIIRQQAIQPGQYQSILSQDGVYLTAGIRYIGDTRGNIWESQVEAVTSVQGILALAGGGN
jgi:hypothetical protein